MNRWSKLPSNLSTVTSAGALDTPKHGLVIVSKDSGFHQMSLLHGHPPKTVWLRVGNAPTSAIAELLREHHATMQRFHTDPDTSLLALA